jgi:hypothetical protein
MEQTDRIGLVRGGSRFRQRQWRNHGRPGRSKRANGVRNSVSGYISEREADLRRGSLQLSPSKIGVNTLFDVETPVWSNTMSQETAATIQAVSGIFSVIVASVAIVIALRVEKRTHERFSTQLKREETFAVANMKPLLSIYPSKFVDRKAITLCNYGLGTAIITKITFQKNELTEQNALFKLFNFGQEIVWDYYWIFREEKYYVQPGQRIKLLELSQKGLAEDGLEKDQIKALLDSFQQQMQGVTITLECSDVFGNQQEPYKITLTSDAA